MVTVKKLSELDLDNVLEFEYGYAKYRRDTQVRKALNKLLDTSYTHAFSEIGRCDVDAKGDVNFDGGTIIAVTKSGKFIMFFSSEWGGVGEEK